MFGAMMLFLLLPVLEGGSARWLLLSVSLICGFFCVSSPLWVYIFFELSLIPILVLIVGWGVQPERVSASYHLLVYTFVFSSPLLLCVFWMEGGAFLSGWLGGLLMGLALMVKTPMYLVHVWLPKAHVEAPTAGSIVLAGILLKMGGVGFIWMQNYCEAEWSVFFFYCVFFGGAASALVSAFQSDGKALVAYSSVAHMNLGMVAVMFLSSQSDSSSSLLMLNHGFVSSSLLLLVGSCFHLLKSRLVYFFAPIFLLKSSGFLVISWLAACNLSVPPSLGFLGEVSVFAISLGVLWGSFGLFCFYFLFVAYYSLFLGLTLVGSRGKELEMSTVAAWGVSAAALGDWCFWGLY